jgi:hypothetical protein
VGLSQFASGSNGSDGALVFAQPAASETILFDPASYNPPKDSDGDGVYHFTQIHIPSNVTLRLKADMMNWRPVVFLVQGDVVIEGKIDLSGEDGQISSGSQSIPGPGGFPGAFTGGSRVGPSPNPGGIYGQPLVGGYGGNVRLEYPKCGTAGTRAGNGWGGAGGGAILIASNTLILLDGSILSLGGRGAGHTTMPVTSPGAGGVIRLLAPQFLGTGSLNVSGRSGYCSASFNMDASPSGLVRIETISNDWAGTYPVSNSYFATLIPEPLEVFIAPQPTVRLISANGEAVVNPTEGSFILPDVVLNSPIGQNVIFTVRANNMPVDRSVRMILINESLPPKQYFSSPLEGTFSSSTAEIEAPLEHGYTRGYLHVWYE